MERSGRYPAIPANPNAAYVSRDLPEGRNEVRGAERAGGVYARQAGLTGMADSGVRFGRQYRRSVENNQYGVQRVYFLDSTKTRSAVRPALPQMEGQRSPTVLSSVLRGVEWTRGPAERRASTRCPICVFAPYLPVVTSKFECTGFDYSRCC